MIQRLIISASPAAHNAFVHRNPYSLGEPRDIIRKLREQRGFRSERALATAAGVSQPTLSRYLDGKTETMDLKNFAAIARVLEVTLSELLGEVPLSTSAGKLRELVEIMENLPEPERHALLAAGHAMVDATAKPPRKG